MRFSPTSTEPLHDILRWVLRGHRIDIIELLRFPALSAILNPPPPVVRARGTSPLAAHHETHSTTTLRLAREYLENAVQRISTNAEGLLHRHQGSWLTIRSCTRSALALLGVKLKCQQRLLQEEEDASWDPMRRNESQEQPSLASSSILPVRWRYAVVQVLEMLRVWEVESPDVGMLRQIVEVLLGQCS